MYQVPAQSGGAAFGKPAAFVVVTTNGFSVAGTFVSAPPASGATLMPPAFDSHVSQPTVTDVSATATDPGPFDRPLASPGNPPPSALTATAAPAPPRPPLPPPHPTNTPT